MSNLQKCIDENYKNKDLLDSYAVELGQCIVVDNIDYCYKIYIEKLRNLQKELTPDIGNIDKCIKDSSGGGESTNFTILFLFLILFLYFLKYTYFLNNQTNLDTSTLPNDDTFSVKNTISDFDYIKQKFQFISNSQNFPEIIINTISLLIFCLASFIYYIINSMYYIFIKPLFKPNKQSNNRVSLDSAEDIKYLDD